MSDNDTQKEAALFTDEAERGEFKIRGYTMVVRKLGWKEYRTLNQKHMKVIQGLPHQQINTPEYNTDLILNSLVAWTDPQGGAVDISQVNVDRLDPDAVFEILLEIHTLNPDPNSRAGDIKNLQAWLTAGGDPTLLKSTATPSTTSS